MIWHETLISVFFKFANFAVLIGMAWYLYKKYIQISLQQAQENKERYVKGLLEQKRALEYQKDVAQEQIEDDKKSSLLLQKRVEKWLAREKELHQAQQETRSRNAAQLQLIANQRSLHFARAQAHKKIMAAAVQQARQDLEEKFASYSTGQDYIDSIVDSLSKDRR